MPARVASSEVSMSSSRASWLTQADTSVTAGRRARSSSGTWSGSSRWPPSHPARTASMMASPVLPLAWRSSTPRSLAS